MATKHETAGWTYYTWDEAEALTKIEAPDTTLESKYNSRMQRVWRSEDGTAEDLVYDSQKLIAEAAGGALSRYYLSEGGSIYSPLVSQLGSQHWFLFDALGSTLGITSEAGAETDTFLYEAFGTSLGRTGTAATPYQYVGAYGYFDEPTVGLEQVWRRWYSFDRWISEDALRGLDAKYLYAGLSPTSTADPFGLFCWKTTQEYRWVWRGPAKLVDHEEWWEFVGVTPFTFCIVFCPMSCQWRKHVIDTYKGAIDRQYRDIKHCCPSVPPGPWKYDETQFNPTFERIGHEISTDSACTIGETCLGNCKDPDGHLHNIEIGVIGGDVAGPW